VISLTERQRRFAELHCPWVFCKDSFTVKEVAGRLSINRRTLYRHIEIGKIKSFKAGAARRIGRVAIIHYLMSSN